MKATLLNTRFYPPLEGKRAISRVSIMEKLEKATEFRLTFLEAAAGSGKTSAMGRYYHTLPEASKAWLTLGEDCNDSLIFWSYLLEILLPKLTQSAENWTSFLQYAVLSSQTMQDFVYSLCNEFATDEEFYFFLDDIHLIKNQEVLASFQSFLENISEKMHFIIGSRYEPHFYIGALNMKQQVQLISKEFFLLSEVEARDFIRQTLGKKLSETQENEIMQQAAGWLGGLQLLASIAENTPTVIKKDKLTLDYITYEIFRNFSKEVQQFLVTTAPFPYFFPLLVAKILPTWDFREMLQQLTNQNFLFQGLNEEKEIFQYHPLLKDFLEEKFKELGEKEQATILLKGAEAFKELGDGEEALKLYQRVSDYEGMMQLLLDMPESVRFSGYYCQIPVDKAVLNIDFMYQKFFYHYLQFDYETCQQLIDKVQTLELPETQALQDIRHFLGVGQYSIEGVALSIEAIHQLKLRDNSKGLLFLKSAIISWFHDDYQEALLFVKESQRISEEQKNFNLMISCKMFYGQLLEELGGLKEAEERLLLFKEQLENSIHSEKILTNYQLTYVITIAGIYLKQGNLDKALAALNEAVRLSPEMEPAVLFSYLYNACEYYFLMEDWHKAKEMLEKLLYQHEGSLLSFALLFRYGFRHGFVDVVTATAFVRECLNSEAPSLVQLLALSEYYRSQGNIKQGVKTLEEVQRTARKKKIPLKIVEGNLQMIALLVSSGDFNHRLLKDLYGEALFYAASGGIKGAFYMNRPELMILYKELGKELWETLTGAEKKFHQDLMKEWQNITVHLTDREQEILELLAQGCTNKEMSARLFISPATVKTHVLSLYRKLNVNSRLLAVEEGRQLGFIS